MMLSNWSQDTQEKTLNKSTGYDVLAKNSRDYTYTC